ncbi:MAG: hypothetical protein GYB68_14255 [Chloroflexi bacterium]|nr:hypothetical protein [Chloroflexota bacterium]
MDTVLEAVQVEDNVYLTVWASQIELEDMRFVFDGMVELMEADERPLYVISNMLPIEKLPDHIVANLPEFISHRAMLHRNLGIVILVIKNRLVFTLAKITATFSNKVYIVSTLDEAVKLLREETGVKLHRPLSPPLE